MPMGPRGMVDRERGVQLAVQGKGDDEKEQEGGESQGAEHGDC